MGDEQDKPTQRSMSDILAQKRTDLAIMRTIIAAERTLMAWIRTSISMISFGFSIYKFFQYMQTQGAHPNRPMAPRNLALVLITLGTISLAGAILQHRQFIGHLEDSQLSKWSLVVLVAAITVLIGITAFIGVLAKSGPF